MAQEPFLGGGGTRRRISRPEVLAGAFMLVAFVGVGFALGLGRQVPKASIAEPAKRTMIIPAQNEPHVSKTPDRRGLMVPSNPGIQAEGELTNLSSAIVAMVGRGHLEEVCAAIERLARFLEGHPETAALLTEKIMFLDRSGQTSEVAALLAAMGQARSSGVIEKALEVYEALSQPGRVALALGTAQDRGLSTIDPSGDRALAQLFELRDIGEAPVLATLMDRCRSAEGHLREGLEDQAAMSLLLVLSLSSHRDPAVDGYLLKLATTDGPLKTAALLNYLARSRSSGARDLALKVFGESELDEQMLAAAFTALRRQGLRTEDLVGTVIPAFHGASAQEKAYLLRGLASLMTPRMSDESRVAILGLIREAVLDQDTEVRSAALVSAAGIAIFLKGWSSVGIKPGEALRDPRFSEVSQAKSARQWASLYLTHGDEASEFERLLGDSDVRVTIRQEAWQGLLRTDKKANAEKIKQLARRFAPMESDTDLKEFLTGLAR